MDFGVIRSQGVGMGDIRQPCGQSMKDNRSSF